MQKPNFPIEIPAFDVNLTLVKFVCFDNIYHVLRNQMANLVAESGDNKGQLSHIVEANEIVVSNV